MAQPGAGNDRRRRAAGAPGRHDAAEILLGHRPDPGPAAREPDRRFPRRLGERHRRCGHAGDARQGAALARSGPAGGRRPSPRRRAGVPAQRQHARHPDPARGPGHGDAGRPRPRRHPAMAGDRRSAGQARSAPAHGRPLAVDGAQHSAQRVRAPTLRDPERQVVRARGELLGRHGRQGGDDRQRHGRCLSGDAARGQAGGIAGRQSLARRAAGEPAGRLSPCPRPRAELPHLQQHRDHHRRRGHQRPPPDPAPGGADQGSGPAFLGHGQAAAGSGHAGRRREPRGPQRDRGFAARAAPARGGLRPQPPRGGFQEAVRGETPGVRGLQGRPGRPAHEDRFRRSTASCPTSRTRPT